MGVNFFRGGVAMIFFAFKLKTPGVGAINH